jgi:hypothetical protein
MSPLIKEPRPTHLAADGQTVPIDEPFDVGGVQFMRPADDSLGAGPEDIINCHCVAIPVEAPIKSEADGHPFRGNQYTEGISSDTGKPIKDAPAYRFGDEHSGMVFYSKERDYSEEYATEKGGSIKDVHPAKVNLQNPLVIDSPDHKFSSPEYEIPIIKHARSSGHDGVVFRNGIDIFYVRFVK